MSEVYLALDTSGDCSFATVYKDGQYFSHSFGGVNSHNEEIDSLTKRVIKEAEIKVEQITAIVIGAGPGSFTGLRIGYAYAKGLATALSIPVYSYSAMEALAYQKISVRELSLVVISDARRGQYFVAAQKVQNAKVEILQKPVIMNQEDVLDLLKSFNQSPTVFTLGNIGEWPFKEFAFQEANGVSQALIQAHLEYAKNGQKMPNSLSELEPFYLREVAAKSLKDRGIEAPRN